MSENLNTIHQVHGYKLASYLDEKTQATRLGIYNDLNERVDSIACKVFPEKAGCFSRIVVFFLTLFTWKYLSLNNEGRKCIILNINSLVKRAEIFNLSREEIKKASVARTLATQLCENALGTKLKMHHKVNATCFIDRLNRLQGADMEYQQNPTFPSTSFVKNYTIYCARWRAREPNQIGSPCAGDRKNDSFEEGFSEVIISNMDTPMGEITRNFDYNKNPEIYACELQVYFDKDTHSYYFKEPRAWRKKETLAIINMNPLHEMEASMRTEELVHSLTIKESEYL